MGEVCIHLQGIFIGAQNAATAKSSNADALFRGHARHCWEAAFDQAEQMSGWSLNDPVRTVAGYFQSVFKRLWQRRPISRRRGALHSFPPCAGKRSLETSSCGYGN